jgi:hypothetical protein
MSETTGTSVSSTTTEATDRTRHVVNQPTSSAAKSDSRQRQGDTVATAVRIVPSQTPATARLSMRVNVQLMMEQHRITTINEAIRRRQR